MEVATLSERRTPAEPVLSVIVPTYNERENVRALVYRLRRALAYVPHEIVFVDDSTDDTPEVINHLRQEYTNIWLHRRTGERGLATAALAGFRLARGECVCVIDADLQHPPELLPTMVEALAGGRCDLVVASRYVTGGSAAGLNGVWRRWASLVCRELVHVAFADARKTTDPLSGCFMFRRGTVRVERLNPIGYKILLEVLVHARDARVQDVPCCFGLRLGDDSKAGLRPALEFLQHIVRLKALTRLPRGFAGASASARHNRSFSA